MLFRSKKKFVVAAFSLPLAAQRPCNTPTTTNFFFSHAKAWPWPSLLQQTAIQTQQPRPLASKQTEPAWSHLPFLPCCYKASLAPCRLAHTQAHQFPMPLPTFHHTRAIASSRFCPSRRYCQGHVSPQSRL